jgi:hypothetical protein
MLALGAGVLGVLALGAGVGAGVLCAAAGGGFGLGLELPGDGLPSARAVPIMRPVKAVVTMSFFHIFEPPGILAGKKTPLCRDNASAMAMFRRNLWVLRRRMNSVRRHAAGSQDFLALGSGPAAASTGCSRCGARPFANHSLSLNAVNPLGGSVAGMPPFGLPVH